MSSGKPEQEKLWQRLQHPPAPREQAVWDGEVGLSVQEERWVRMSVVCPESSRLHPGVAVGWENIVFVGGPRAGTSRGGTVWVRFLVTVKTGLQVQLVPSGLKHPSMLGEWDFSPGWRRPESWWSGAGGSPTAPGQGGGLEVVQGTFPHDGLVSWAHFLCEGPQ